MIPIVVGISGVKQAGKSTVTTAIYDWCHDIQINKNCPSYVAGCVVKSFADNLKNFLISSMGLQYNQCYGSDEEKNSLTEYRWENLPLDIREAYSNDEAVIGDVLGNETNVVVLPRAGYLTARELMQIFGTDIMRNMFSQDIWVNSTLSVIMESTAMLHIIQDVRFVSEVDGILGLPNGYVIRLNRKPHQDSHPSETALDSYDWSNDGAGSRVALINNSHFSIEETNEMAINCVSRWMEIEE